MGRENDNDTLIAVTQQSTGGKLWRPIRRVIDTDEQADTINRLESRVTPTKPAGLTSPIVPGVPSQLLTITATESPVKQQDRTFSQVAVSFTRDAGDATYGNTRIYLKGYKGNSGRVLQSEGRESPIIFLLETTKETITVIGLPVGLDGTPAAIELARSTAVKLDGVVSAPPAPTVTQNLVAVPGGYQFTFSQLSAQAADIVDCYKVYRNTTNDSASATVIRTIKHDPKNASVPVVVQDVVTSFSVAGTYFYWVSAVNTVGLESVLTAAQSASVGSYSASSPLSVQGSLATVAGITFSYTSTTTSITWSWAAGTIYNLDGTTISVGASSQAAFTGLSSSTTYYFSAYYNLGTSTVTVVLSDTSSGTARCSIGQIAQTVNADTHIPLQVNFTGATSASGSGGGGSGGGGIHCFSGNTKLLTRRGTVAFLDLQIGDELYTAIGTWRKVTAITRQSYEGPMMDMGNDELVTPGHLFFRRVSVWQKAVDLFKSKLAHWCGDIWNAHVGADSFDEHSYVLANGTIAHNIITD